MSAVRQLASDARLAMATRAFARRPLQSVHHERASNVPLQNPTVLDLVTVAFNNPMVVGHQTRLLARHLNDPFVHTVADASTDVAAQAAILAVTRESGAGYIRLPPNPHARHGDGSNAHGTGLNWLARHYLQPRQAAHYGFIDHDIYPVRGTGVLARIENGQGLWGHPQFRDGRWYLWPGFAFFSSALVTPSQLDFRPAHGVDTGGGMWDNLFSTLLTPPSPTHSYGSLRDGVDKQSDGYENIGDWIHTFNASGWKSVSPRDHLVNDLLNRF